MRTILLCVLLMSHAAVARAESAATIVPGYAGGYFVAVRDCGGTARKPCDVVLMGGRGSARLAGCTGRVEASPAARKTDGERWYFAASAPVTFTCPTERRVLIASAGDGWSVATPPRVVTNVTPERVTDVRPDKRGRVVYVIRFQSQNSASQPPRETDGAWWSAVDHGLISCLHPTASPAPVEVVDGHCEKRNDVCYSMVFADASPVTLTCP